MKDLLKVVDHGYHSGSVFDAEYDWVEVVRHPSLLAFGSTVFLLASGKKPRVYKTEKGAEAAADRVGGRVLHVRPGYKEFLVRV